MKIKLDENLPASLADELVALGHEADTVQQEGLKGHSDPNVWRAAQREGRFFMTQDLDFSDVRHFRPGTHAGLMLVRLAKPGRLALRRRVLQAFEHADADAWSGCFVVLTDVKLRIHCAGSS
jgi:predicted nuclease of predicted toxin-antitoxin system